MTRPLHKDQGLLLILLLAVGFIACPLMMRLRSAPPNFRNSRAVYRWRNGAWIPAPNLAGGTAKASISPTGKVWTTSPSYSGINRWDGAQWVRHSTAATGGFALLGEEVWCATRTGVERFDGQRWRTYPEALKSNRPFDIAAGPSGVWVIDAAANLSHFDGESWSIENLLGTPPGENWESGVQEVRPELAVTGDGALWLSRQRLWCRDRGAWHEIPIAGAGPYGTEIMGQDGNHVWVHDAEAIFAVSSDGAVVRRFDWHGLPLQRGAAIYRVAESGGRIWVATTKDLLALDGSAWKRLGIPPGATLLTEVAAAPDGGVWTVAETRSLARIALWVAPPLAAGGLALLLMGALIVMLVKARAEASLAAEQAAVGAAGAVPGLDIAADRIEANRQTRGLLWKVPLFLIGFPYLFMAVRWGESGLRGRWPHAPEWLLYAVVLSPLALLGVAWIWKRRGRRVLVGREVRWLLTVAVVCFVLRRFGVDWLPASAPLRWAAILAIAGVAGVLVQARDILAALLTRSLVRAADYDRALERVRLLGLGRPTAGLLHARARILSMAGKPAEAETYYRQALAKGVGSVAEFRSEVLLCLGFCLTDLGRYDEAQRCFDSVVALGDRRGSARAGLADLLLAQQKEPEKALTLLDQAIPRLRHKHFNSERFASRAWALALLGRLDEAQQAIDLAVRQADPEFRGLIASVHWRIGRALMAARRTAEAIDHFRTGYQADPRGWHGGLSRSELQHLGCA